MMRLVAFMYRCSVSSKRVATSYSSNWITGGWFLLRHNFGTYRATSHPYQKCSAWLCCTYRSAFYGWNLEYTLTLDARYEALTASEKGAANYYNYALICCPLFYHLLFACIAFFRTISFYRMRLLKLMLMYNDQGNNCLTLSKLRKLLWTWNIFLRDSLTDNLWILYKTLIIK